MVAIEPKEYCGSSCSSAGFDYISDGVVDLHKRERAAWSSPGGEEFFLASDVAEVSPDSGTRFEDDGHSDCELHDGVQGVLDGFEEAG